VIRALEVEGFKSSYWQEGSNSCCVAFGGISLLMHGFFCSGSSPLPVPQNCPLHMHDSFMSQDSKNRYCWSFSSTLATLSVYIFQAGSLKCKIKAQCAARYAKRIPGFDDIGGFSLASAPPCLFGRLPAKSFIDSSLSL
jgi:hypothetical protein